MTLSQQSLFVVIYGTCFHDLVMEFIFGVCLNVVYVVFIEFV